MTRHRRTDPACARYRRPRTRIGTWWHDTRRGYGCHVCHPVTVAHLAAANDPHLLDGLT